MAEYPSYPRHVDIIVQALQNVDARQAQARARTQMQAERHQVEETARYFPNKFSDSKAMQPVPKEDDFPIKFIPKEEESFRIFHKLEERRRGETTWLKKFRLKVALVTILGLVGYLVVLLIER